MEIIETGIEGLVEIRPKVFGDSRGHFFESYRQDFIEKALGDVKFVQDNQSFSEKGVLRGLHYQKGAMVQGKLVRVVKGKVLDVAVDLRPNSSTFGQYASVILDTEKHNMLYVPAGFAHGFYTLENAIFLYKCTNYYHKESEGGLLWNDEQLKINWQLDGEPLVSEKDKTLPTFAEIKNDLKW
jgi:dTDP-4-dehydrorhamnose 3,5-epimerase